MSLSADLKRFPMLADSGLLCLEAWLCLEVLRPWADDFLRLRDVSRDVVDIVPGRAVTIGVGCSGDVSEVESVKELGALSGGVGGPFVTTRSGAGCTAFGPTGVYNGVS